MNSKQQFPRGGAMSTRLDEQPPEAIIIADHNAMILRLQRQIVEAARERPYYTFRNLVFLCWRRFKQFHFDELDNLQLQAVLDDVRAGVQVPHFTEEMESEICNCTWPYGHQHQPRCAAQRFRAAIEE